ncbi:MAG: YidC/Oxa1 family membrane protein insertase [Lachnospiraceae bacterium]|nr:YidC/Oxa1 family membrane protein insertase [Lachnospiraceae bacterium]
MGSWPIIGWIAWLFGWIMRGIYLALTGMNIYSVTLCIVVFTIVTKMLLLPLTIKQQKSSKIQALMQPEIQALQKKYQNRRDQASMAKMQAEQQQIYQKYGAGMLSGCLPSLIQLPLLFALYPVIMYFGAYVPEIIALHNSDPAKVESFFTLFGSIDLLNSPWNEMDFKNLFGNLAWLIPILSGGLQFLSVKLTTALTENKNKKKKDDNPAAGSMKIMTYFMPIFSVYICFTLPAFLGVYWVVQSLVMIVQQFFINKHFAKIPVEDIIRENIQKANKKRARKGLQPINEKEALKKINQPAEEEEKTKEELEERDRQVKSSTEFYNSRSAAPGSLAAKAGMVKEYNERHNK